MAFEFGHRPALDREAFLVAAANAAAVAWIDRWPDWPAPALVLQGPPASGKTHLASVWRARARRCWKPDETSSWSMPRRRRSSRCLASL
ncbi:MAG: hypothetical protein WDN69_17585 [Aliidongia sp.]